ncbi:hypothetical protein JTE90_024573 [Oedothorax gibbosus]|uniref:Chitin-binding type-2 domain-containing protein n=1 Tax=Oedothorax gibbosus TaxID=931172 RepID=A0AAV6VCJ7_9ARAC|nr:hypothetical protein JTE90_024573 [Oedothorax gibbosus]
MDISRVTICLLIFACLIYVIESAAFQAKNQEANSSFKSSSGTFGRKTASRQTTSTGSFTNILRQTAAPASTASPLPDNAPVNQVQEAFGNNNFRSSDQSLDQDDTVYGLLPADGLRQTPVNFGTRIQGENKEPDCQVTGDCQSSHGRDFGGSGSNNELKHQEETVQEDGNDQSDQSFGGQRENVDNTQQQHQDDQSFDEGSQRRSGAFDNGIFNSGSQFESRSDFRDFVGNGDENGQLVPVVNDNFNDQGSNQQTFQDNGDSQFQNQENQNSENTAREQAEERQSPAFFDYVDQQSYLNEPSVDQVSDAFDDAPVEESNIPFRRNPGGDDRGLSFNQGGFQQSFIPQQPSFSNNNNNEFQDQSFNQGGFQQPFTPQQPSFANDNNNEFQGQEQGSFHEDPIQALKYNVPGSPGADYPILYEVPETSFDCNQQQFAAGIYGDVDAQCQVFHFCKEGGGRDSFLCPNGTVFNQEYFVCDWWYNYNCADTPGFYNLNAQLYWDIDSISPTQILSGSGLGTQEDDTIGQVDNSGGFAIQGGNTEQHRQAPPTNQQPLRNTQQSFDAKSSFKDDTRQFSSGFVRRNDGVSFQQGSSRSTSQQQRNFVQSTSFSFQGSTAQNNLRNNPSQVRVDTVSFPNKPVNINSNVDDVTQIDIDSDDDFPQVLDERAPVNPNFEQQQISRSDKNLNSGSIITQEINQVSKVSQEDSSNVAQVSITNDQFESSQHSTSSITDNNSPSGSDSGANIIDQNGFEQQQRQGDDQFQTNIGNEDQFQTNIGNEDQFQSNIGNEDQFQTNIGNENQFHTNIGNEDQFHTNIGNEVQFQTNIGNEDQFQSNQGNDDHLEQVKVDDQSSEVKDADIFQEQQKDVSSIINSNAFQDVNENIPHSDDSSQQKLDFPVEEVEAKSDDFSETIGDDSSAVSTNGGFNIANGGTVEQQKLDTSFDDDKNIDNKETTIWKVADNSQVNQEKIQEQHSSQESFVPSVRENPGNLKSSPDQQELIDVPNSNQEKLKVEEILDGFQDRNIAFKDAGLGFQSTGRDRTTNETPKPITAEFGVQKPEEKISFVTNQNSNNNILKQNVNQNSQTGLSKQKKLQENKIFSMMRGVPKNAPASLNGPYLNQQRLNFRPYGQNGAPTLNSNRGVLNRNSESLQRNENAQISQQNVREQVVFPNAQQQGNTRNQQWKVSQQNLYSGNLPNQQLRNVDMRPQQYSNQNSRPSNMNWNVPTNGHQLRTQDFRQNYPNGNRNIQQQNIQPNFSNGNQALGRNLQPQIPNVPQSNVRSTANANHGRFQSVKGNISPVQSRFNPTRTTDGNVNVQQVSHQHQSQQPQANFNTERQVPSSQNPNTRQVPFNNVASGRQQTNSGVKGHFSQGQQDLRNARFNSGNNQNSNILQTNQNNVPAPNRQTQIQSIGQRNVGNRHNSDQQIVHQTNEEIQGQFQGGQNQFNSVNAPNGNRQQFVQHDIQDHSQDQLQNTISLNSGNLNNENQFVQQNINGNQQGQFQTNVPFHDANANNQQFNQQNVQNQQFNQQNVQNQQFSQQNVQNQQFNQQTVQNQFNQQELQNQQFNQQNVQHQQQGQINNLVSFNPQNIPNGNNRPIIQQEHQVRNPFQNSNQFNLGIPPNENNNQFVQQNIRPVQQDVFVQEEFQQQARNEQSQIQNIEQGSIIDDRGFQHTDGQFANQQQTFFQNDGSNNQGQNARHGRNDWNGPQVQKIDANDGIIHSQNSASESAVKSNGWRPVVKN